VGRSGTVGGRSPKCFFGFYLRSIPKPDPHIKDVVPVQQESLGTDMLPN